MNNIFVIDDCNILCLDKDETNSAVQFKGFVDPQEFVDKLVESQPTKTPILPHNTIAYKRSIQNNKVIHDVLIELPPAIRTIFFKHKGDPKENTVSYNIAYPYLYVYLSVNEFNGIFSIPKGNIYCTAKSISSYDDILYAPWLLNISSYNGNICWYQVTVSSSDNLRDICQNAINGFFDSYSNGDLGLCMPSLPTRDTTAPRFINKSDVQFYLEDLSKYTKEQGPLWPLHEKCKYYIYTDYQHFTVRSIFHE